MKKKEYFPMYFTPEEVNSQSSFSSVASLGQQSYFHNYKQVLKTERLKGTSLEKNCFIGDFKVLNAAWFRNEKRKSRRFLIGNTSNQSFYSQYQEYPNKNDTELYSFDKHLKQHIIVGNEYNNVSPEEKFICEKHTTPLPTSIKLKFKYFCNSFFPGKAFINTLYEKDQYNNQLTSDSFQNSEVNQKIINKAYKPKFKVDHPVKFHMKQERITDSTILSKKSFSSSKEFSFINNISKSMEFSSKYTYSQRNSFINAKQKISNQLSLEKDYFSSLNHVCNSGISKKLEEVECKTVLNTNCLKINHFDGCFTDFTVNNTEENKQSFLKIVLRATVVKVAFLLAPLEATLLKSTSMIEKLKIDKEEKLPQEFSKARSGILMI